MFAAGCQPNAAEQLARLDGLWEVYLEDGAAPPWLSSYPNCNWGRETWMFGQDFVEVSRDVLCPGVVPREHNGCHAGVRADAGWDDVDQAWVVGTTASANVARRAGEDGTGPLVSRCTAEVQAGRYRVERISDRAWRWEVSGPEGTMKLSVPQSTEPDYAGALLAERSEP